MTRCCWQSIKSAIEHWQHCRLTFWAVSFHQCFSLNANSHFDQLFFHRCLIVFFMFQNFQHRSISDLKFRIITGGRINRSINNKWIQRTTVKKPGGHWTPMSILSLMIMYTLSHICNSSRIQSRLVSNFDRESNSEISKRLEFRTIYILPLLLGFNNSVLMIIWCVVTCPTRFSWSG